MSQGGPPSGGATAVASSGRKEVVDPMIFKPVTVGKASGTVIARRQSLMTKTIEEKKEHLFLKQAADYSLWISEILGIPPLETDLLASLQNGIVLGLLVQKIAPEKVADLKFPAPSKNVNVFQAVENIQRFLEACQKIGIKEEDLFQPEDLLEGINKLKVLRTLQSLRRLHEGKTDYEYDKFEKANFDLDFLGPKTEEPEEPEAGFTRRRRTTIKVKVGEPTRRRSLRLFRRPESDSFSAHWNGELSPASTRKKSRFLDDDDEDEEGDDSDAKQVTAPPTQSKADAADSKVGTEPFPSLEPSKPFLKPSTDALASCGTIPFPDGDGIVEIPAPEELLKEGDDSFLEPMDENIMAHLLSRGDDEEDEEEGDSVEAGAVPPDGEEEVQESELVFETPEKQAVESDEIIATLKTEIAELQDLLKTEIVSHMREMEMTKEQLKFTHQQLVETEKRAIEAEKRSRELEEKVNHLLMNLEERDESLALLSQLYNEQLKKVAQAEAIAESEAKARSNIEAILKRSSIADDVVKKESSSDSLKIRKRRESDQKGAPATETTPQRRKSYVRKTKTKAETPTLKHLDELEEELGIKQEPKDKKSKKKRGSTVKQIDSPVKSTSPLPDHKEDEEKAAAAAALPKVEIPGPKGYTPYITLERAAAIHKATTAELWAHLPESKPFVDQISERERARQEIIYELVSTEELYISDLELIIRVFMAPLYDMIDTNGFTKAQYDLIFRNIIAIAKVNITFYKNLMDRKAEQGVVIKTIGDLILKHVVFFNVYAEYCGDQKRSTQELKRLIQDNAAVRQVIETCKQNPECRKLDLFAFLLLPMQRLTKYPLLLKNLVKVTRDSEADFDYIKAAATELARLIDAVDQYAHRREELHRISELDAQLNWSIVAHPHSLADSEDTGRYLLQEGALTRLRLKSHTLTAERKPAKKQEQLYCFLFNDMFIFAKQISLPDIGTIKFVVQVEPLKTGEYSVRNVPEATNGIGAKNVFLISSKATGTIVLQASSTEEKNKWILNFRKEDLVVESVITIEEQGTLKVQMNSPTSRHSSADLLSSPEADKKLPSPQRHSAAVMRSNTTGDFSVKQNYSSQSLNPNISIEQLVEPEFDGWLKILTKGAFQTSSWKNRWCVLKDFCLYYFPDDQVDSKALGMILLPTYRILSAKDGTKKNIFKLEHPNNLTKPLVCCADTIEYFEVWVQALTHATMAKVARRNFWL